MTPAPKNHTAAELAVGMTAQFEREITENNVLSFAANCGDLNPLHVDQTYAAGTNYGRRIVHGAFQVSLASALIGMNLPGRNVLLGSIDARFSAPLHFPARVRVQGEIVAWNLQSLSGRLRVSIVDVRSGTITAEIGMGFAMHEEAKHESPRPAAETRVSAVGDRPAVLITGASGGIGSHLVRTLQEQYRVIAVVHRGSLPDDLAGLPGVETVQWDMGQPGWRDAVGKTLATGSLFGIVHCAWPGMPRGGLLRLPDDVIQKQLAFGTLHLVELARLLGDHASAEGGRLIAIGSIAGGQKPSMSVASYSLGKAAMEHTVRLLACELAGKKITVNAVCPGFVPVGMNMQADQRRKKIEAAHTPLGRTCEPEDVAGAVAWLLSPEASFVSAQILGVTGGQF